MTANEARREKLKIAAGLAMSTASTNDIAY
jgi:hypothetical protein